MSDQTLNSGDSADLEALFDSIIGFFLCGSKAKSAKKKYDERYSPVGSNHEAPFYELRMISGKCIFRQGLIRNFRISFFVPL